MAEVAEEVKKPEEQQPPVETKTPGKIVSAGEPTRMDMTIKKTEPAAEGGEEVKKDEGAAPAAAAPAAAAPAAAKTPDDLTDDQIKAHFEKLGIPFEGMDKIKEKLSPAAAVLTDEQKAAKERERELKIVSEHVARSGTHEQYTTYKAIVAATNKELGYTKEIEDLMAEGLDKEEAESLATSRYFQYTDAEIEEMTDEKDKAKAIKQREIGLKKLEAKGGEIKKTVTDYLNSLSKHLDDTDAEKLKVEQHTSKVEDAISKYQRSAQIQIGQLNEKDVSPIDFEIASEALAKAKDLLLDRDKFEKTLLNKDGELNIDFILPHLVNSFSMEDSAKKAYLIAQNRTIEEFEAKFGGSIPTLGATKKEAGTPGKLVSAGEPQVFRPSRNN